MTLKQGSKVKSDTCKRLAGHDFLKLLSHSEPLGQMIREIVWLFDMMNPLFGFKDVTLRPCFFLN